MAVQLSRSHCNLYHYRGGLPHLVQTKKMDVMGRELFAPSEFLSGGKPFGYPAFSLPTLEQTENNPTYNLTFRSPYGLLTTNLKKEEGK